MWLKIVFPGFILAFLAGFAFTFCGSAAGDPFNGLWKLNLAKSKIPPPFPQSQTVRIEADETGVRMEEVIVNSQGERLVITVRAKFDGEDYPVEGTPFADTVAYRHDGTHTIKGVAKKAGRVVVTETAVLSPDGKTVTVTYLSQDAEGRPVTSTGVFERQE